MKYLLILCLLSLLLSGCRQNTTTVTSTFTTPVVTAPQSPEKLAVTKGKYFFDFDEVIYYKTELTLDQFIEIYDKKDKTRGEAQLLELVTHRELTDTLLLADADIAGFIKKEIPKEQYPAIKEIFRENFGEYTITTATAVFGDLYIFKKQGKIIGTAKLCYDCGQALFTGTDAKTEQFGRIDNEFEKLREIVK